MGNVENPFEVGIFKFITGSICPVDRTFLGGVELKKYRKQLVEL